MVFFAIKTWVVYIIFIVEKAINFDEWFMIALWFIPLRRGGEAAGEAANVSSDRSYRLIFQTISITLCHFLSISYIYMYIYTIYIYTQYIYISYIYITHYIYIYIIPRYPYHLFLSLYSDRHQACGQKAMRRRRLQALQVRHQGNDQQFLWEAYGNPMGIWWELYDLMGIIWWC